MDPRIEKALLYIEQNVQSDIPLAVLAEASGMSPFHFHRRFKAVTGETPAERVRKTRIIRAAHDLLVLSEMSVIEAAFKYGFSSPATFARTFKRVIGKSPRQFRVDRRAELGLDDDKKVKKLEREYRVKPKLPVRFQEALTLSVQATTLEPQTLNAAYARLLSDRPEGVTHAIAVFVEPPFGDLSTRPHLIGFEQHQSDGVGPKSYTIESGYYAHYDNTGDFQAMQTTMLHFRKTYLDPSSYTSASSVFFERVPLPEHSGPFDYFAAKRTLNVMVQRK